MDDRDRSMVAALAMHFAGSGFDIAVPFRVGAYNEHPMIAPHAKLLLPAKHANALAVIVGNSGAMWAPFIQFLKSDSSGAAILHGPDPLDAFTREVCSRVVAKAAPGESVEIVYAFETVETHGRCCSMNTAGHVAGLAFYDAHISQRSIHPVYGPWFAYRAVLVFNERSYPVTKAAPFSEVGGEVCPPAERSAVSAIQKEVMDAWGTVPEQASWDGLLRVTDTFQLGKAKHRYPPPMARFHYLASAKDRQALLQQQVAELKG